MGAARSNSTSSSTRSTGSPLRATTRSAWRCAPSRRARLNSIAIPLESMNSRPPRSTTTARAELVHEPAHERDATSAFALARGAPGTMVAQGELDRAALEPAAQLERRATARAGMLDRVGGRLAAGGDDLRKLALSRLRVSQPAPQKRSH